MRSNFSSSLALLLKHEGGYVNHPDDPGGRTNQGITQRVYEKFLGRDVTEEELKDMPPDKVFAIYKTQYWNRGRGDDLPTGVDLCVFDWAVNAGTSRAGKALQQIAGVPADGIIGSQTFAATSECDPAQVVEEISQKREDFYRGLGTFDTFGRGWLRRNDETRDVALRLIAEKV